MIRMRWSILLAIWTTLAAAQFGNIFDQMFGGQHVFHHGGHQQQEPPYKPGEFYQYNYDKADCPDYLCDKTLMCVQHPRDCPCEFPAQQQKCKVGKDHFVCINKNPEHPKKACAQVEAAAKLKS